MFITDSVHLNMNCIFYLSGGGVLVMCECHYHTTPVFTSSLVLENVVIVVVPRAVKLCVIICVMLKVK